MSGATARAPEDEAAANGLATKADLANLKADLKDTLASKDDLKELKTDLKELKADLKDDLKELKADRKELKADVLKVATIIVGALASVGIITAAIIGLVQLLFG